MQGRAREEAYTLVELIAAVAISGVLLSIAVPGFQKVILDSRRATVVNELFVTFQWARAEALKRGQSVVVCPTEDGLSCAVDTTAWSRGWLVFANAAGSLQTVDIDGTDPDDVILRAQTNSEETVRIGNVPRFAFRPFGTYTVGGTLTICDSRGAASAAERRGIVVSAVGRPRVTTRKPDGSPLDCP